MGYLIFIVFGFVAWLGSNIWLYKKTLGRKYGLNQLNKESVKQRIE